jgi:hypothetical protein
MKKDGMKGHVARMREYKNAYRFAKPGDVYLEDLLYLGG